VEHGTGGVLRGEAWAAAMGRLNKTPRLPGYDLKVHTVIKEGHAADIVGANIERPWDNGGVSGENSFLQQPI